MIAFMNITTVAIFYQLILSYILFGLMYIGNVLDKNTRLSDWLLLLFFFLNGVLSRVFQNEWYEPLKEIYEGRLFEGFSLEEACVDCA